MPLLSPKIEPGQVKSILDGIIAPKKDTEVKTKARDVFNDQGLTINYAAKKLWEQIEYSDDRSIIQRSLDTVLKVQGALEGDKEDSKTNVVQFVFTGTESQNALAVLIPR